ncbi:hypothetical protein GT030_29580 [Streptomyces sp. SID1328]|uniref:hypothetical protein n=1 Tax=Streptomyces sp. SID1328 TaxID=2690250 RepID=UPI00136E8836|nr:hypothetical protein [Streptomyces sp. SID1328]MYV42905.1 hypothetical protein [Streptomyces sp. SID1328]
MTNGTAAPIGAFTRLTNDQPISIPAVGLYLASVGYTEALRMPDPARTLDTMCDTVAEIMPDLCKVVAAEDGGEFAEELRAATTVRLRAYSAIEHARADVGDGYNFVFDLLAESLDKGGDPDHIRTAAADVPGRIRALAEAAGGAR